MKATFFIRVLTLFPLLSLLPLPLLADLPAEFLVAEAFSPGRHVLWKDAVGIATLRPFSHSTHQPGRSYQLRSLPQVQSPLIKVFSRFDLQADVPSDTEEAVELKELGWEDREIKKELAFFLDWPFFVSTFGYMEDYPMWCVFPYWNLEMVGSKSWWTATLLARDG